MVEVDELPLLYLLLIGVSEIVFFQTKQAADLSVCLLNYRNTMSVAHCDITRIVRASSGLTFHTAHGMSLTNKQQTTILIFPAQDFPLLRQNPGAVSRL